MIAKLILDKKREGHALGSAEIREFVEGFTRGEIPDYQMAALAMAVCCRGMNARETADLTEAMMKSGRCLAWDVPTADKRSSQEEGAHTPDPFIKLSSRAPTVVAAKLESLLQFQYHKPQ